MEKTEDASIAEDSIAGVSVSDDEVVKNDPQMPDAKEDLVSMPEANTAATRISARPPPTVEPSKMATKVKASAVDRAKKEVQSMIATHEMDENDSSALQKVFKENEALKDKVRFC